MKKDLILKKDPRKGVFYVRPYLGKSAVTGKPLRPYKSFPGAADEGEARKAAEAWAAGLAKAAQLNVARRLGELMPRYVQWLSEHGAAANTVRSYGTCAKTASKYLQDADPDEVDAFEIDLMYTALMRGKGGLRGGNLSANSVRKLHGFLSGFWCWMLSEGICTASPMPLAHKPSRERSLPFVLSDREMRSVLDALGGIMSDASADAEHVRERSLAAASYLAVFSGIREGEACGLDRGDIIPVPGQLALVVSATAVVEDGRAKRQPKTKGRRARRVPLAEAPAAEMQRHLSWQDEVLPAKAIGQGRRLPVFCDAKGARLKPAALSAWFSRLCKALGLPADAHFHSLRHTFASEALAGGADIRTVAEVLGHAREGFTLETYTHMLPGRDREAADAVARKYGRGRGP